ncbi:peptidylprolyl isomerase [Flavisolibacter ginsenosidimutans]|uniref:Peptidylprolyl isomerase n=1 Tax=Flavisolibacter ginsenosidimutans TaxID=661481 RepID=A0A5B8ULS8_9BACT|nr:peptidylprolyl isomerase [Flavisolibacter ginsenosidimutans]QEC57634.1 peptidylprolyl isomerase [Flavisolibacter ginsenosidimutans]
MKRLLLFVFCLLTFYFSQAQPQKVVADKIIAVVGDRIILKSDISNTIADMARQGAQVPENANCAVLDQALVSKVLMMQAMKDSLPVSDDEIEAELDQRVRYFVNQYGSKETVEQMAGKSIYQIKDDARESVKENKLAQAMQRKIVDGVKVTPAEVQAYFNRIPKDTLPFFEAEYQIGQIIIYPKASREMETYVVSELMNYKRQVEAKTASFESLAKRYSEDPGSKERGGQYQINRQDKTWDPAFVNAAFRLKEGQISNPFKSKFGYHIVQLVSRNGDEATVRHILRIPPVNEEEIAEATTKLDSVRKLLVEGKMDFNTAGGKFSDDEAAKFAGPYLLNRRGETLVTIDEMDKSVVSLLDKLKIGEYSQPMPYTDEQASKKGVRLLYLKSKSEPHRMNMRDDYNRIASAALEEKKFKTLDKWLTTHINTYYIMLDPEEGACPQLKKWADAAKAYAAH